jgi:hypothetical protein
VPFEQRVPQPTAPNVTLLHHLHAEKRSTSRSKIIVKHHKIKKPEHKPEKIDMLSEIQNENSISREFKRNPLFTGASLMNELISD